ncbi:uncharacterized protein LOC124285397 [Haliotis rubra]|uniref:uncharacterized protein LOC124285397 n=1 Tax=Haliotis rubra TaxID=36100 RepID=UPI001EE6242B|nr:uncharacterized protein LOC124285397 [Haliotis rubra]
MSEEEITAELKEQAVTAVKRFTIKKDGITVNTNTYLMTFARSTLPASIKAGYLNIGVEVYVPNPLRCYKCQRFGHGSNSCRNSVVCYRCGDNHESTDCKKDFRCCNCDGTHAASSKSCPVWQRESSIMKLKCHNNISYLEAKKLFTTQSITPSMVTYSAAVSRSMTTSSVSCQTDLTWIRTEKPVASAAPPKSPVTQSTSASQTESQPEIPSQMSIKQPVPINSTKGKHKGKKQNRKESITIPSSPEVTLQNSFESLDMEVTLSSQDRRKNSSSSHSRERSPIEPP